MIKLLRIDSAVKIVFINLLIINLALAYDFDIFSGKAKTAFLFLLFFLFNVFGTVFSCLFLRKASKSLNPLRAGCLGGLCTLAIFFSAVFLFQFLAALYLGLSGNAETVFLAVQYSFALSFLASMYAPFIAWAYLLPFIIINIFLFKNYNKNLFRKDICS